MFKIEKQEYFSTMFKIENKNIYNIIDHTKICRVAP